MTIFDFDVVAECAQFSKGLWAKTRFEIELIWQELVVEPRGIDSLLDVEAAFRSRQENVGHSCDDASAAGRAEDKAELAALENDRGGH